MAGVVYAISQYALTWGLCRRFSDGLEGKPAMAEEERLLITGVSQRREKSWKGEPQHVLEFRVKTNQGNTTLSITIGAAHKFRALLEDLPPTMQLGDKPKAAK